MVYEDDEQDIGDITSFKNFEFESEEMKNLLRIEYVEDDEYKRVQHDEYDQKKLFPDWMLNDQVLR